jgi:hypothetical protein
MMCFQGCLSEIGLVNIYHHFPCFGGDGFMTSLLGQGCTATNIDGNIFVVLLMWLKEQLTRGQCAHRNRTFTNIY